MSQPQFRNRPILVIEDEPRMLELMRITLEGAGFIVSGATSGQEGLNKLRDEIPDLVVLDLNLPDISGFDVLREIRNTVQVPVIMVTVQNNEDDRIMGLELGADDYLGKPFNHRELISRIKAVLRRADMPAPVTRGVVKVDDYLTVDLDKREVQVGGQTIHLRPTEFKLLYQFLNNPGRILTHEQLLSRVWGAEYRDDTQILRLYVTYLRKKLEPNPNSPRYITNERGLGYRFRDYRTPTA
jgi:two-component system KDP operon response regulator KdpE